MAWWISKPAAVHTDAPEALHVPAGHGVQAMAPGVLLYVPAAHAVAVVLPVPLT